MKGFINGSFSFKINENIFSQNSLTPLLRNYAYALTEWSRSGGDDNLLAAHALDKAKSTIEEMITITIQVNILLKGYGLHLYVYWLTLGQ